MKHGYAVFLVRAQEAHGDRYDYSQVKYVNMQKEVNIICKRHGVFQQTPAVHYSGAGCNLCAWNRLTREEFLDKVNKIHGNKYDYSKCEYSQNNKKLDYIKVICPEHGEFNQRIDLHLNGNGCPGCSKKRNTGRKTNTTISHKTGSISGDKFVLNSQYETGNGVMIKLQSEPFKNHSQAEEHLKEIEQFVELIDGKYHDGSIKEMPQKTSTSHHTKDRNAKIALTAQRFKSQRKKRSFADTFKKVFSTII